MPTTIHPSPFVIMVIAGSVRVLGYIECKLLWDDQFFVQKLVVLDRLNVSGALLLGWDFLTNVGCIIIDARANAVYFRTQ